MIVFGLLCIKINSREICWFIFGRMNHTKMCSKLKKKKSLEHKLAGITLNLRSLNIFFLFLSCGSQWKWNFFFFITSNTEKWRFTHSFSDETQTFDEFILYFLCHTFIYAANAVRNYSRKSETTEWFRSQRYGEIPCVNILKII